uniref:SRCR domain-containing protein n=1 Tax=Oryzias sinensis TaxID=183150 RepID=A0A8C7WUQ0_9TELE
MFLKKSLISWVLSDPATVRLMGSSRCSGELQVKSGREWRAVYAKGFLRRETRLANVCKNQKCGSHVSSTIKQLPREKPVFYISPVFFDELPLNMEECWYRDTMSSQTMEITCLDSVRLENGSSRCSGRLEVKSNNLWSSVCEDDFDLLDAEVVCRELGCGAPSVLKGALYGEAEAPILTREFLCEGHESVLLDCGSSWRKTKACPPDKAVGLTCSDPVRLMGSSRCSGELQVKIGREWRAVDAEGFLRRETTLANVCKNQKCGSHVSLTIKQLPREKPVFQISPFCFDKFPLNMEECVYRDTMSSQTIEITCLGNKPSDADCMYVSLSVCDASLSRSYVVF